MAETDSGLRRSLQLALAGVWLLDAILQFQPVFFTKAFANGMLRPTADGNPSPVSHSINWASTIIANHSVSTNSAFALIQLAIALGIACRATVKPALALSVAWSLVVWWFGEGLGGILHGGASALAGGPGAVLLYGVLAVLLWPTASESKAGSFVAAGRIGDVAARAVWAVVWCALAIFSLVGSNRSPDGASDLIRSTTGGEPGWLVSMDGHIANLLSGAGLTVAIVLALVLLTIALRSVAVGGSARIFVVAAVVVSIVIWVFFEGFGGILGSGSTDPNSGPLLIILALSYWPLSTRAAEVPSTYSVRPLLPVAGV
ncbi:MAG: hypothetical protein WAM97_04350 [Acidimicrobiales bacterium]